MKRILVVDDEKEICTFFTFLLKKKGYEVNAVQSGQKAIELMVKTSSDLALLDLKMPDIDGLTLMRKLKEINPHCQAIIMTGYSTIKSAIAAMQNGALDYIEKPFDDIAQLESMIDSAFRTRDIVDSELQDLAVEAGIIFGKNRKMLTVVAMARRVAAKNVTVLIQGETGTGKEVLARFIHNCSSRAGEAFIPINCAAISETLLESELFGYEKGAFTGANRTRKGFFEIADSGTIFLDEIGEASLTTQAKLLRVLETGEFIRVGGETVQKTDSRIIAATNVNLNEAVTNRVFRQDLFYRLDVLTLKIPPLRERKEDIPIYLDYFLKRYSAKDEEIPQFSDESLDFLTEYDWPGNVRELVNLVQLLVTVVDDRLILPVHLPDKIKKRPAKLLAGVPMEDIDSLLGPEAVLWMEKLVENLGVGIGYNLNLLLDTFSQIKNQIAKNMVEKALKETRGDRKQAADMLEITPRQLKYLYRGK